MRSSTLEKPKAKKTITKASAISNKKGLLPKKAVVKEHPAIEAITKTGNILKSIEDVLKTEDQRKVSTKQIKNFVNEGYESLRVAKKHTLSLSKKVEKATTGTTSNNLAEAITEA